MANVSQTVRRLTHQTEERLAQQKATQLGYQYANLEGYPANFDILSLLTEEEITKWQVVPFAGTKDRIQVGVVKPDDTKVRSYLGKLANTKKIALSITVVSESSINYMLGLYEDLNPNKHSSKKMRL